MIWNLDTAKENFLASGLKTEIAKFFSDDSSNSGKILVSISAIELACGGDLDEEDKLTSLLSAVCSTLNWVAIPYFSTQKVEFSG